MNLTSICFRCVTAVWAVAVSANMGFADDSPEQILDTVLFALKANDQQIGALRCDLTQTLIHPNVTSARTHTFTDASGGTATFRRAPETVLNISCVIDGPRLRHEILSEVGTTKEYMVFDGNEWTQYNPDGKRAWKRLPGQTKGMILDPRMLGLPEEHGSIVDAIQSGTLVSAEVIDTDSGHRALLATEDQFGHLHSFTLDASRNFLPAKIISRHKKGGVRKVTEFSYQSVPTRPGWFLKRATTRGLASSDTKQSNATNLVYVLETEVTSIEPLDSDTANRLFHVDLPPGVVVHDGINRTVTVVGRQ